MRRTVSTAWQQPYQRTGNMLETVLGEYMKFSFNLYHVARYASITQSSGVGKSRMVDELAKQTFCIPMSLGSTSAYPPQDVDVVHYFHSSLCMSPNMRTQRVQLFMYALFETALARVKAIASEFDSADKSMSDIASRFRQLMSDGMEYGRHGQYRQEFYADVCKRAAELPSQTKIFIVPGADDETPIVVVKDKTGNWTNLTTAAKALTSYFSKLFTRGDSIDAEVTLLPDVQRALRLIRALPIFALFLSTVITVENVSPPPQISSSERLLRPHDVPFRPIVWTPIDVLAARITNDKVWTLTEVASTHHIAHLGRPLFAAMYDAALTEETPKALPPETLSLQQALACIAVRIPLEFDPAPLSPPVGNDADVERNLVADHMRLLLYADRGFSRIVTTAASEPLLAEAAGSKMISFRWLDVAANSAHRRKGMDVLLATMHHFALLDLGEGGEFATALLLLYARDRATTIPLQPPYPGSSSDEHDGDSMYDGASKRRIVTVNQFLEALLGENRIGTCAATVPRAYHTPESAATPLATAFRDGLIYFNHFIKVNNYEVVNQQYLLLAISRGAAIICANGQTGVDIVVPILIGTELKKEKVTAILVQVKNHRHFGPRIQYPVFMNMNPYRCGLFDRDVKEPPPVLRMVFALASPEAAVTSPTSPVGRSPRRDRTAAFTAYDIWCAGASSKTFDVIQEDEDKAFANLLKAIRSTREYALQWKLGDSVLRTMRQMQPLVSTEREHLELFADLEGIGEYALAEDVEEEAVE